ncbi:MAG TPA: DUF192 domain-containing protein [Candidatus Omnitrophota bacterium]|nr:DUF192 domain-containing protein [Candidatus Omnitrophota bacterium]HSA30206.1 DUF192 domain-containing protein [Candidatus Omnitrophota bacterium]
MKILNTTKSTVLVLKAEKADTPFSRIRGLLGRASIAQDEGLIITDCRSIHMMFMKFAIDVVFVDRHHTVIGVVKNIRPFRMSPYFLRASYVVEMAPGRITESRTEIGDQLRIEGS